LEKHGIFVELGVELASFEQLSHCVKVTLLKHDLSHGDRTIVEETSYKWVIGADGAKGVVRKQLGLSFKGETKEQKFVIGDIHADGLRGGVRQYLFLSISILTGFCCRSGTCGVISPT